MSIANYKGLLQEYAQKRAIDLPLYETRPSLDGVGWECTVSMSSGGEILQATGNSGGGKKKVAEQVAAQNLYERLSGMGEDERRMYPFKSLERKRKHTNDVILVDLDNASKDIEALKGLKVIGFAGKMFNGELSSDVSVFIAKKAMKNMADHMMTLYAGINLLKFKNEHKRVIIITSDNFGEILCELLIENGVESLHYSSIGMFLGMEGATNEKRYKMADFLANDF